MTEFFNKKEETLHIELTEHGKYLLSQGLLKPEYYCFYDDEILYDAQAAPSGGVGGPRAAAEAQNKVDRRIRYETPNLKVMPNIISAERRQAEFQSMLPSALATGLGAQEYVQRTAAQAAAGEVNTFFSTTLTHTSVAPIYNSLIQQNFVAKYNLAADPIGTSALNTRYDAAWHLNILPEDRAKIDSNSKYELLNLTSSHVNGLGDGFVKEIPQLNVTIDYQTFYRQGENHIPEAIVDIPLNENAVYLAMKKNYLLLGVDEKNTNNEVENFDIEVYYVSSSNASNVENNQLTQKTFVGANPYNNSLPPSLVDITTDHVEYYMNVYTDKDVPVAVVAELKSLPDYFAASTPQGGNIKFVRDLYMTEDEEACD
tara:strand:+ start:208 stop:1320 length:1113 start_codon:yes stop_codon:yes gene_type:complete